MKNITNIYLKTIILCLGLITTSFFISCEDLFREDLPDSNSKVDTVLPSADFSYIPNANDFATIEFSDLSFESTTYLWDFGGGATSSEQDPVYTFAGEGTYPVTLTVSDANGASDSITQDVVVEDLFVPITPQILNGDFSDGQNDWKVSSFPGGTTSPFNSSSDGSWLNYDGSDNGAKTAGAKWTRSTSAGEWVSSSSRYAYQAIIVSPNTDYILEYEYAIKDDTATDPTGGRRIVGEILDGHFSDGNDAVASSNAGALASHVGTQALGKTVFTTVEERFTSNDSGQIAIWIYGVTPVDAYVDNVKVYPAN